MIGIIAFVAACLVLQAVKQALRGKPKVTVSIVKRVNGIVEKPGEVHVLAECGCNTVGDPQLLGGRRVARPCAAHEAILRVEDR